jgi:hypothetical protein
MKNMEAELLGTREASAAQVLVNISAFCKPIPGAARAKFKRIKFLQRIVKANRRTLSDIKLDIEIGFVVELSPQTPKARCTRMYCDKFRFLNGTHHVLAPF